MNNTILKTPTLYSVSSKSKIKEWTVSVESNHDGTASIIREHGYTGAKIQKVAKVISKGKNIGRANETSPAEQAVSEALSLRQKRLDTGYTEEVPDLDNFTAPELPMLAHPFTKRGHNIVYPCFVQPKLDGVRCFAKKIDENTITFTSRKGKAYTTLDHLIPVLLPAMNVGDIIDGEIYIHGRTFQHIVRLVKKLRPESITLQFHVYDMICEGQTDMEFWMRSANLRDRFGLKSQCPPEIVFVETHGTVEDEDGVKAVHDEYVRQGYEGVIIRNKKGVYKFDNRSADLQKYKEFIDSEFEIIGGRCSDGGLHDGCVVFECVTEGGTFEVYPRGSLDQRREMFDNLDKYVGKMLTVRYQQLSEDGIPIFPIGIVVRDYE